MSTFSAVHFIQYRKMKMYEEQELTMQVFSEPEIATNESDVIVSNQIWIEPQFFFSISILF